MVYSAEVSLRATKSASLKKNLGACVWSLGAVGMGQGRFIYPLKSKVISLKFPEILKACEFHSRAKISESMHGLPCSV